MGTTTTAAKKTTGPDKRAASSETIEAIFHEAMRSYEEALKSGIRLQEESINLWKELLSKLGSPEEFQAKLKALSAEVFPMARKHMEEFIEIFNRNSSQAIDLFGQACGVYQAPSAADAQRRVRDLVESSLATLRLNVHTVLNTNARILVSWKDLVDRFGPAI